MKFSRKQEKLNRPRTLNRSLFRFRSPAGLPLIRDRRALWLDIISGTECSPVSQVIVERNNIKSLFHHVCAERDMISWD